MTARQSNSSNSTRTERLRLLVTGNVQGVGFRPFVWRRATELGLSGWVRNESQGVQIEVQGTTSELDRFLEDFQQAIPLPAQVDSMVVTKIEPREESEFSILASIDKGNRDPVALPPVPVQADLSICGDCLRELFDPEDRRFRYPFINCTRCGPRFSIIEDVPYDRQRTSMRVFEMCSRCRDEYNNPWNRRFHAQANACVHCGPAIWFAVSSGSELGPKDTWEQPGQLGIEYALEQFRSLILQGRIVAIQGIGGFHLACDATQSKAVECLRRRKGRAAKPFAVMVGDVEQVAAFAQLDWLERKLLTSPQRPIVLLRKKVSLWGEMLERIAPKNAWIGVLLPYSPLHYLLLDAVGRPLVMTSGNLSDEPIVRTHEEARERLPSIADGFLLHNRPIIASCDDSVLRILDRQVIPIRRSRGYAPLPIHLPSAFGPTVLAVGGEIKSAACVAEGDQAFLTPHVGDMASLESLASMRRHVQHLLKLSNARPKAVAADLHPGYLSVRLAEDLARTLRVPLMRVQHHYAHALSLIAEKGLNLKERLLICCFDGTGYGADGAIWGGEFLIVEGDGYERFAHLQYSPLPGGDNCIRKPYRSALAQLWAAKLPWDAELQPVKHCSFAEQTILKQQLHRRLNCISSSSMGRLFDAIASLLGVRQEVDYEAQAAMELEAIATDALQRADPQRYRFTVRPKSPILFDPTRLLQRVCQDVSKGIDAGRVAVGFHIAVAKMIEHVAISARRAKRIERVGLTGGVFQNALLLQLVEQSLEQTGFEVLTHSLVPANDGGLALGQVLAARRMME